MDSLSASQIHSEVLETVCQTNTGGLIFKAACEDMICAESTGNHQIFDAFSEKPALYRRRLKRLVRTKAFNRCFWCDMSKSIETRKLHKWRIDLIVSVKNGGDPECIDNQIPVCASCYQTRYKNTNLSSDTNWQIFCSDNFIYSNKSFVEGFSKNPSEKDSWLDYYTAYRLRVRREDTFKKRIRAYKKSLIEKAIVPPGVQKEYSLINAVRPSNSPSHSTRDSLRKYLAAFEGSCCVWCSIELDVASITLDHIIPKSSGGSHWIKNIVASCADCNSCRGSLPADIFLRYAKNPNADLIYEKMASLKSDPRRFQNFWSHNSAVAKNVSEQHQCSPYLVEDFTALT